MKIAIDKPEGSLVLERVPFDSSIFGFEVGRVSECRAADAAGYAALHTEAVLRARAAGIRHVTRRVLGDAYAEIAGLERSGYGLSDLGIVFDHDLRDVPRGVPAGFRIAEERDIERVVAECAGIFKTSRYYHDPSFSPEGADEVHRQWIWNSFRGRADAIVIPDDASAFVTCAVDAAGTGNIALFGVAPRAQGRGIGQALLRAGLGWFAERAKRVEVKTQSINVAAARMYERGGFRLFKSELTYGRAIESETRS